MKVHFAGSRKVKSGVVGNTLLKAGVNYRLESFYDVAIRKQYDDIKVWNKFNHVIIDSGLFTLMFGAEAKKGIDVQFCEKWFNDYVQFINDTPFINASFVEMDVQKKISPEYAWELRLRMKAAINKGTVINVYHLEDGNPDKLIDHSDYIAVSIPELRLNVAEKERLSITRYIARKAKQKGKKVHLLGCTEKKYLETFSFCDTCDSTSWMSAVRWGENKTHTFGNVNMKQIRNQVGGKVDAGNDIYWNAYFALQDYKRYAGDQG